VWNSVELGQAGESTMKVKRKASQRQHCSISNCREGKRLRLQKTEEGGRKHEDEGARKIRGAFNSNQGDQTLPVLKEAGEVRGD